MPLGRGPTQPPQTKLWVIARTTTQLSVAVMVASWTRSATRPSRNPIIMSTMQAEAMTNRD